MKGVKYTRSSRDTHKLGMDFGRKMKKGFLCLYGDLGAGKTTFVRGLAMGMGIKSRIQSPTFTYSRVHEGKKKLYHFDFYRLQTADHLLIQELLECYGCGDGIVALEWADKIRDYIPKEAVHIYFEYAGENERKIFWNTSVGVPIVYE